MYRAHARATPVLQRTSLLNRKISGGIVDSCGLLFKTKATKQNTCTTPRSEELQTQKLKSHLVRTELKRSPFKAWSRLVYSHTCYAYCQGFLPCLFLPLRSIHLHFFQTSPDFSCVGCG